MDKYKMRVYISGAITNEPDYKRKFAEAESYLKSKGFRVFNPTILPDIFDYNQFMTIDLAALKCCDAIYMLDNWEKSEGAKMELQDAQIRGLAVLYQKEVAA